MREVIDSLKDALEKLEAGMSGLAETGKSRNMRHASALGIMHISLSAVINIMEVEDEFGEILVRGEQNAKYN
jgi:hypothetical protein